MGFLDNLKQSNSPFKRGLKAISNKNFNLAFEIAADNYDVNNGEDSLKLSDELKKYDFPSQNLLFLEGFIYMHFNNHKKALDSFDEFLINDSYNLQVLYSKMEILFDLKDFKKAFKTGKFILDNFNNLKWDCEIAGYFKEANLSQKIIHSNTVFVVVHSLINLKEYETALEFLDELTDLNPDNPSLYNYKYSVFSELKDYESALFYINKAVYLDEDNNVYIFNKGNVLAKLNRHEEAVDAFNQALAKGTPETLILHFKGLSFMALKEYDKARNNFKRLADILNTSDIKSDEIKEIYEKSLEYLKILEEK